MKRRDLLTLVAVAVIAGVFSLLLSGVIFSTKKFSAQVPVVDSIKSTFPDIKNDPSYSSFLNDQALDLTQPVQVGGSQNPTPFTQSLQQ